jgi:hypothetical protein
MDISIIKTSMLMESMGFATNGEHNIYGNNLNGMSNFKT